MSHACPNLLALLLCATPAAAQWVEEPGRGWASLTVFHLDTRSVFDLEGVSMDFPGLGHSVASAAFLTVARGLAPGVDFWVQGSFQRLRFDDLTGKRTSTGIGDARFYVRVSPPTWVGRALPLAVRAGVKVPVGDFDVGTDMIPLGDGQRDWEVVLEAGRSFHPRPLYLIAWAGQRWREAKDGGRTDFGDERFFLAALGGEVGPVGFKVTVDGWRGDTPVFNGTLAVGAEREMLRVAPSLLVGVGPGQVELGARVPLSGRSLPSGTDLVVGYFTRFGG